MITGQPGAPQTGDLVGAHSGLTWTVWVEAVPAAPAGPVVVVPPTAVVVTETSPGTYRAGWTNPTAPGGYRVAWQSATTVLYEDLLVTTSGVSSWVPSVADIADAAHGYTRAPWTSDMESAGMPHGEFTDATVPTAVEVEAMIDAATREVEGRVGVAIKAACWGLARETIVARVVMMIALQAAPAGGDDAAGEHASWTATYLRCLDELTRQAREPIALRVT